MTMSTEMLTAAVIAANVLGGAMALPQALKLLRSRQVRGVSTAWAAISATVNGWWVAYGFGVGDVGIVPVSAVSVIAYLTIAVALVRFGPTSAGRVVGTMTVVTLAIGTVPLVVLGLGGWAAAGITLGALYGIQLSPAVVTVYRSHDVSGVSAATWTMALAEAVLWGVYGFAHRDPGLIALAATGSTMSALVLLRLFVRRPRRDHDTSYGGLGLAPA